MPGWLSTHVFRDDRKTVVMKSIVMSHRVSLVSCTTIVKAHQGRDQRNKGNYTETVMSLNIYVERAHDSLLMT